MPGSPRDPANAEHAAPGAGKKCALQPCPQRLSEAATPPLPTRLRRSTRVSLCADHFRSRDGEVDGLSAAQPFAHLLERGTLRNLTEFGQQVIGKRHAGKGGARFESAVDGVGDVSNLDHPGHVHSILACAAHVNVILHPGYPPVSPTIAGPWPN